MSESKNVSGFETERQLRADTLPAVSTSIRYLNLTVVILPFLGFVAVIVSLWGRGFHWVDCGLLLGMYVLTAVRNHCRLPPTVYPPGL